MIRITAGQWRGKQILSPKASKGLPEVRPTTALMRESVFNRLQNKLRNSRFLDCFSGSGIMGVEALSRHASFVLAIEQNRSHVTTIKQSLEKLGVTTEQHKIAQQDVLKFLSRVNKHEPFDIVFADPPYSFADYARLLEKLDTNGWLADNAVIIIEHDKNQEMPESINNKEASKKIFGDSCLSIYQ